jgi:hypothetical protein
MSVMPYPNDEVLLNDTLYEKAFEDGPIMLFMPRAPRPSAL